jgi:hypothetical protein
MPSKVDDGGSMIWGLLLHLGYNMWSDHEAPDFCTEHIVIEYLSRGFV